MDEALKKLLPNRLNLLVYLVIALGSLGIATAGNWLDQIFDPALSQNFGSIVSQRWSELSALYRQIGGGLSSTVVTVAFWAAVGSLLYVILWLVYSIIHGIINEIELSLVFVHPRSFKESKHWLAAFSHFLMKLASIGVLIGYGVLLATIIWPAVVVQFAYALLNLTLWSIVVHGLGALLVLMLALHLLHLLTRLVLWR